MTPLGSIQSRINTELSGESYISGCTVVLEDGTKQEDIRTALATTGFVIVVMPPIAGTQIAPGQRVNYMRFTMVIRLTVSPEVNSTQGTPINIFTAIGVVANALMTADVDEPAERFEFAGSPVNLVMDEPGFMTYALTFEVVLHLDNT